MSFESLFFGPYSYEAMVSYQREAAQAQKDLVWMKQMELSQNRQAQDLLAVLRHYAEVLSSQPNPGIFGELCFRQLVALSVNLFRMASDLTLVNHFGGKALRSLPRPVAAPTQSDLQAWAQCIHKSHEMHVRLRRLAVEAGAQEASQPNEFENQPANTRQVITEFARV